MKYTAAIDEEGFQDRYHPLRERRDQINEEIPRLDDAIKTAKSIDDNRVYLIREAKNLSERWDTLEEGEKGKIAKELIQKVMIGEDSVEFTLFYLPEFSQAGNDDRTVRDSWQRPA